MLRKSLTEFGLWLVPQKHKHVFHYDKSHVSSKRGLFHENSDNLTASACVDMQCGMDWRKKTRSFLRPTRNLRAKQTECPRKRQVRWSRRWSRIPPEIQKTTNVLYIWKRSSAIWFWLVDSWPTTPACIYIYIFYGRVRSICRVLHK